LSIAWKQTVWPAHAGIK